MKNIFEAVEFAKDFMYKHKEIALKVSELFNALDSQKISESNNPEIEYELFKQKCENLLKH